MVFKYFRVFHFLLCPFFIWKNKPSVSRFDERICWRTMRCWKLKKLGYIQKGGGTDPLQKERTRTCLGAGGRHPFYAATSSRV